MDLDECVMNYFAIQLVYETVNYLTTVDRRHRTNTLAEKTPSEELKRLRNYLTLLLWCPTDCQPVAQCAGKLVTGQVVKVSV